MKILETISSMLERTIIYEHNGKRNSLTRPGMISYEKMIEEINEECQKTETQTGTDIEKTEEIVPEMGQRETEEILEKQQDDETEDSGNNLSEIETPVKTTRRKSIQRKSVEN